MLNFRVWIEESQEVRDIQRQLLANLGIEEDAEELLYKTLGGKNGVGRDVAKEAVAKLGLPDDRVAELQNWIAMNRFAFVKDLVDQIVDTDVPVEREPTLPSRRAKLPPEPEALGDMAPNQFPQVTQGQII